MYTTWGKSDPYTALWFWTAVALDSKAVGSVAVIIFVPRRSDKMGKIESDPEIIGYSLSFDGHIIHIVIVSIHDNIRVRQINGLAIGINNASCYRRTPALPLAVMIFNPLSLPGCLTHLKLEYHVTTVITHVYLPSHTIEGMTQVAGQIGAVSVENVGLMIARADQQKILGVWLVIFRSVKDNPIQIISAH